MPIWLKAWSEYNYLLGTYNEGTLIGMLHLNGFEMYALELKTETECC